MSRQSIIDYFIFIESIGYSSNSYYDCRRYWSNGIALHILSNIMSRQSIIDYFIFIESIGYSSNSCYDCRRYWSSLARPPSPTKIHVLCKTIITCWARPCSFRKVGARLHITAWSEDDVVESGSIIVVDITAEGEVAPPVPVEIDDEEAQLEVDDAERGDIVAVWIKNFINVGIFPAIIKGAAFKDLKKTMSFLNQCGVRLIDKDKVEWLICLLDPCFNVNKPVVIKCTKRGASNACTHLDKKHYITSSKTMATNKKLVDIKKQLDLSDPTFKKDPKHWFEV